MLMRETPSWRVSLAWFAYILIFVTPFDCYIFPLAKGIGLTPTYLMQIFMILVILILTLRNGTFPKTEVLGYLQAAFVMVLLIGCIFAENTMAAMKGTSAYVFKLLPGFICAFYFLRTKEQLEVAAKVFIAAGIATAIMGMVQLIGFFFYGKVISPPFSEYFKGEYNLKSFGFGTGAFGIPGFTRFQGFFNEKANQLGAYMLIPFSFSMYFSLKCRRVIVHVITIFMGITIFLSVSRNAYVGMAGMLFFIYCFIRFKRNHYQLVLRPYIVALVFISIMGMFYISRTAEFYNMGSIEMSATRSIKTPVFLITRLNPFLSKGFAKSVTYFTEHRDLAMVHGFDNMGFGMGSQNFDEYVFEHYPVKYGSHSNFIIFLGDNGIWGFLIQILIVFFTLYYVVRDYYRQPKDEVDHLPLFMGGAFLGLVLTGVVRTYYMAPFSFIVMGMVARYHVLSKRRSAEAVISLEREPNRA